MGSCVCACGAVRGAWCARVLVCACVCVYIRSCVRAGGEAEWCSVVAGSIPSRGLCNALTRPARDAAAAKQAEPHPCPQRSPGAGVCVCVCPWSLAPSCVCASVPSSLTVRRRQAWRVEWRGRGSAGVRGAGVRGRRREGTNEVNTSSATRTQTLARVQGHRLGTGDTTAGVCVCQPDTRPAPPTLVTAAAGPVSVCEALLGGGGCGGDSEHGKVSCSPP